MRCRTLTRGVFPAPAEWVAGFMLAAALVVGTPAKPAPEEAATAVSVRLENSGETSKLVFDLSKSVEISAFVLADPQRVVVDLPEINFQIDSPASKPARPSMPSKSGMQGRGNLAGPKPPASSLVQAFRFGLLGPGRSRIVIDLANPARIVRADVERIGLGEPARLVIALAAIDAASFKAAAANAGPGQAASPVRAPLPVPADGGKKVIVIDPGHGGIDAGASGAGGAVEKSIVFEVAKILAQKLETTGQYRAVLTRNDDSFVSLSGRVQAARDHHAALFISLHADTLAASAEVQGATIYTLAEKASDAESARVAEKENQADTLAGVSGHEEADGINDILFDLTRRETRAYSHLFARTLVGLWQAGGRANKNPQRAAGFRVLRAPDVPSVLVELGYLSSQRDAADLVSAAWRERTTDQIVQSVERFFTARLSGSPQEFSQEPVKTNDAAVLAAGPKLQP